MGSQKRDCRRKKSNKVETSEDEYQELRENTSNKSQSYKRYIHTLLKSIDPEFEISSGAMGIMNSLIKDHLKKLANEAGRLAAYNKKSIIAAREIQTAVRLTFPGELGQHAVSEGKKALDEYMAANSHYCEKDNQPTE